MELCSPGAVKELLGRFGLSPRKGYGQNFLVNPVVPEQIAEASAASGSCDAVLEIGPGLGVLTAELCERFGKVVSVEIDRGLIPLLGETLGGFDNFSVVNADFMDMDLRELISLTAGEGGGKIAVCANLPYYITTPIIMKLIEEFPYSESLPYTSITVMVQSEVADRLAASPGSGDYGAITASVGLRCSVKRVMTVPPSSFYPPPKVISAVIQLIPHERGIRSVYGGAPDSFYECEEFGRRVSSAVSAVFIQRRKTLVNALSSIYPKENTVKALEMLGFRADIRGERLSPADFCALVDVLGRMK